jgi:predicted dinucleotide-binding enzyme
MTVDVMDKVLAIIGAGSVGAALGERFGKTGYTVRFGVRDPSGAGDALARAGAKATAHAVAEAIVGAEIVFVTLPAAVTVGVLAAAGDLSGKIIVDCTNPVGKGLVHAPPPEGSVAAAIAAAFPAARVIKGWNTFGAEMHADPRLAHGEKADVLLAGDDAEAKATLSAIATESGFVPIDAGPLRNAAVLENLAILWIHLALVGGKGRNIAFKLLPRA